MKLTGRLCLPLLDIGVSLLYVPVHNRLQNNISQVPIQLELSSYRLAARFEDKIVVNPLGYLACTVGTEKRTMSFCFKHKLMPREIRPLVGI